MITDLQTNTVYYSNLSAYTATLKAEVNELKRILARYGIGCHRIIGTRDFFCRDYMPVQRDKETYIQFRFHPDYLLNDPRQKKYVSNTKLIHQKNVFLKDFIIIPSEIVMDGGNIIKCNDKVIITDKVLTDNPKLQLLNLSTSWKELLQASIILIPRYPDEPTGHADGLIRFIDERTVLTINLVNEHPAWVKAFRRSLINAGLTIISLQAVSEKEKEYSWGYINYLQVGNLIVMPFFGYSADKPMKEFFGNIFKGYIIESMDAKRIIKQGGVLNCFTWNIYR